MKTHFVVCHRAVLPFVVGSFAALALAETRPVPPLLMLVEAADPNSGQISHWIELNSATTEELRSLPRIDDLYARKIIEGRPYISQEELLTRNILPPDVYNKIRARITVRTQTQPAK
jgi:competence protein ComEA